MLASVDTCLFYPICRAQKGRVNGEGSASNQQEDLSLILPGVGIVRQDRTTEQRVESSKGPRRPVKSQRLSDGSNSADVHNPMRANFTLDGVSVGPR